MRKFSHQATLAIALTLISFGAFTQLAFAEPENCSARFNHCIRDGEKLASFGACNIAEKACENRNRKRGYEGEDVRGRGAGGKETNKGGTGGGKGNGKGVIDDDPNRGWNGQYTTVVVTDGAGTSTYTVKQGVPTENGQMILAPNGARYHVWDPELARQLKAAGVNAAYANPATAKNEYALRRDKVVRDRAVAAGQPVPQPTGHRNSDALGNAAPVVNDHRQGTATAPTPGGPPPAAPIGTVSTNAPPSNGAEPAIRDHRKASGGGGGVTMTQTQKTAGGSGSARSTNGGNDRKPH
ncbi:hypothetical protein IVB18_35810 [Bradyrhizobium sp. 186]|uniref:hypothetical protein n=1 Tax=Bradyrhizobium sp. 186 TaxID=2782654 RepID=UPI002000F631|nr:hypothetical protein [Bradyrhizobium sp. 186]UPK33533.1 hypothetical protein IVB18_35810 [Bradyrhizobium sp. 186]